MSKSRFLVAAGVMVLAGCSSDEAATDGSSPESVTPSRPAPGITAADDETLFTTAEYTLEPGQEKFLCFAANTPDPLQVEGYSHEGKPTVHHVIFARTTAPEPEGYSECDTLFRLSWEPLYLAGAGSSQLDFPAGYANALPADSQLLVQLHLLNTGDQPVTESVSIKMRNSKASAPKPVSTYAFGNMVVNLPAKQASSLVGNCELKQDVRLLAAFPHMHLLGKRLSFEVARGATGAFENVFKRDPYDFDDQHVEPLDLLLATGDRTRVTCEYDNPHDEVITFGESTMNEMCFLVGFAGEREKVSGCFGPSEVASMVGD